MANGKSKDLVKRTQSNKVLKNKGYKIAIDLADMQSLSKYYKGNRHLLRAIHLFSKYAWAVPIKNKKGTSMVNAFQKIISEGRKPNKIWIEQGSKFCINSF